MLQKSELGNFARGEQDHVDLLLVALAFVLLLLITSWPADAQAAAIYTFPPASQPVCSASFDVTNKLLVTSCTIGGVAMPAISYNPRLLEGNAGGVFTVTFGGVTITYTHNLPADPLKYIVGATPTGAAAAIQCGLAPLPACPTIPW